MSLRLPASSQTKQSAAGATGSPLAALEHELFAEQAGTLIRITQQFEAALNAVNDCAGDNPERAARAGEAARALWMLVVQRDCLGLGGTARLIADYNVPQDVTRMSGVAIPPLRRRR